MFLNDRDHVLIFSGSLSLVVSLAQKKQSHVLNVRTQRCWHSCEQWGPKLPTWHQMSSYNDSGFPIISPVFICILNKIADPSRLCVLQGWTGPGDAARAGEWQSRTISQTGSLSKAGTQVWAHAGMWRSSIGTLTPLGSTLGPHRSCLPATIGSPHHHLACQSGTLPVCSVPLHWPPSWTVGHSKGEFFLLL